MENKTYSREELGNMTYSQISADPDAMRALIAFNKADEKAMKEAARAVKIAAASAARSEQTKKNWMQTAILAALKETKERVFGDKMSFADFLANVPGSIKTANFTTCQTNSGSRAPRTGRTFNRTNYIMNQKAIGVDDTSIYEGLKMLEPENDIPCGHDKKDNKLRKAIRAYNSACKNR